jgi:hydrogenase maturation protease
MSYKSILILGVGSPFGADRLGWQAVAALERQSLAAQFPDLDIRFEQSDRPGSRLLTLLGQADAAIIIDAMRAGLPAGSVRRFAVDELDAESGLMSTHGFGVADALALGQALGGLPGEMVVVGIEMGEGEPAVESQAALFELVQGELVQMWERLCRDGVPTD